MSEPADPLRHALTPEAHRDIYQTQIRPALIRGTPQARPQVTILGGQPGSGKTHALDALPVGSRPGGIVIASDRLRPYHPMWPELLRRDDTTAGLYTSHDARAWVAEAIGDAIAARLNVVFDTASDDPARMRRIIGQFRAGQYRIHMVFVATASAVSQLSVLARYQAERDLIGGGRYVADPDRSHPGVLATAQMIDRDHLADTVTVYDRAGRQLYRNELTASGIWARRAQTPAIIQSERTRQWTAGETASFLHATRELTSQMDQRWHPVLAGILRDAGPLLHPSAAAERDAAAIRLAGQSRRPHGRRRVAERPEPEAEP